MSELSNTPTIFIVEDDEDDRLLLSHELEKYGLENISHYFSSVDELVGACQQYPIPSLILINAFMNGMDIENAIALIRSEKRLSPASIALMVAAKLEKDYLRSSHLNVIGYITKPVNGKILKRLVDACRSGE